MGKSTISMAIFHGKMLVHQRVSILGDDCGFYEWEDYYPCFLKEDLVILCEWIVIVILTLSILFDYGYITGWWFQQTVAPFHFIYGLSSFPLTNLYVSEGWRKTTSQIIVG